MLIVFVAYLFILTTIFYDLHSWFVYNIRQIITPILIVGFSFYLRLTDEGVERIVKLFYKLSVWAVFIGILFKLVDFWQYLDLTNYFNLKGIPVNHKGVSYMFYEPAFSYAERMVSTVLDPISLGHMLAAALILAFYRVFVDGKKRIWYLAVIGIGLLLTFSKGAILQVVIALFLFNRKLPVLLRVIIPFAFVISVLLLINIKGILMHMVGIKNAILYLSLFGHGIGMVGNYAKMFAEDLSIYYKYGISDTFIGSIIGQIGLIGFIWWSSFFIPKLRHILSRKKTYVGVSVLASQLILSILSENTLNLTSFIVPGIIASILIKKEI